MGAFKDLTGQRFGRLVVLYRDNDYVSKKGYHCVVWKCKCDCGNYTSVRAVYLKNGSTTSCGCKRIDTPNRTTHGQTGTRLHNIWMSIKNRCHNKNEKSYIDYGGRGIKICEEWNSDFMNFYLWAKSNGYNDTLSIDRIDNDGNYEPSNCRWVTNKVQQNNKRNNHLITFNGMTKTMSEWGEYTGIGYHKIKDRLNKCKWSVEKALTTK